MIRAGEENEAGKEARGAGQKVIILAKVVREGIAEKAVVK